MLLVMEGNPEDDRNYGWQIERCMMSYAVYEHYHVKLTKYESPTIIHRINK